MHLIRPSFTKEHSEDLPKAGRCAKNNPKTEYSPTAKGYAHLRTGELTLHTCPKTYFFIDIFFFWMGTNIPQYNRQGN